MKEPSAWQSQMTEPTSASRGLGSLLIGYREGSRLVWAGKVSRGRGLTESSLRKLRTELEVLEQKESPFDPKPPGWLGRNAHWVKPRLVVEVSFFEWTEGGQLRHASLEGFRPDKSPDEVVREIPAAPPAPPLKRPGTHRGPSAVIFPKLGITKLDLARFYRDICEWALPHLRRRPLTLVQCVHPISRADALRSQCRFLHHTSADNRFAPASVPRVLIPELKKLGEYLWIDSLESLIALLDGEVIEFHAWNAEVDDVEHPDRIVLDLDPGEGVGFSKVVAAAHLVRSALEELGLESWPKTTGGKGLHISVPFRPELSWDDAFAFSRRLVQAIAASSPGFTTSFAKARRAGQILLDYKRNYRTSIAVAGFSVRARPDAPVAMPLAWREVSSKLRADEWTVKSVGRRLARLREDPWDRYWRSRQRLTVQMKQTLSQADYKPRAAPSSAFLASKAL